MSEMKMITALMMLETDRQTFFQCKLRNTQRSVVIFISNKQENKHILFKASKTYRKKR